MMEFVGHSAVEESRERERSLAWKWKFALFWPVHVANKEDGSPLMVWLRFYEQKQNPETWMKWTIRYKGYPEIEYELPAHWAY